MVDARIALQRLIEERGGDYTSLSRLIGRNPSYIQQFIRRGVPRKLDEEDRRILARHFGIPDHTLGGPSPNDENSVGEARQTRSLPRQKLIAVPFFSLSNPPTDTAPPINPDQNEGDGPLGFDLAFLESLTDAPERVAALSVAGDAMAPTLQDGDTIVFDQDDGVDRVRDGIYVLRLNDAAIVKRVAVYPWGGLLTIGSDNPAYPPWPECHRDKVEILGRVIWFSRRLA